MKIQGLVTGIIRDAETGEVKRTFEEKNTITETFLSIMSNWGTNTWNNCVFGPYMFVSSKDYPATNRWDDYIFGIEAVGYTESGITQPRQLELATNGTSTGPWGYYYEFQQRFSPPASTRTIRVVGLSPETTSSTNYTTYRRLPAQAWVRLTTDCIQETTETLDIFYRVQFLADYGYDANAKVPRDSTKLSLTDVYLAFRRHTGDAWSNQYFNTANTLWHGQQLNLRLLDHSLHYVSPDGQIGSFSRSHNTTLRKANLNISYGINDGLGRIVGSIGYGDDTWARFHKHLLRPTDSPIQNIFGHASTATKPFYDSTTAQTGTGLISVNGNTWTNPDYSKLYRIDITNSGGVGAATYKFSVRDQFGFATNTYSEYTVTNPIFGEANVWEITQGVRFVFNVDGEERKTEPIIRYNKRKIVGGGMYAQGLAVVDVVSGETVRFSNTTTPALPTTDIGQFEVDKNGAIWVACRATGAYRISPSFTTITKFDNTTPGLTGITTNRCFGVAPGVGDRVWAVFDGGLFYTDDFGASWTQATVTFATITADWTKVKFLKADRNHADHRLAFAYDAGSGNLTASWWNLTTSTNVQGPLIHQFNTGNYEYSYQGWYVSYSKPIQYFNVLNCSPNQGIWATRGRRTSYSNSTPPSAVYTFGTTSVVTGSIGSNPNYNGFFNTEFGISPNGNDAVWTFGESSTVSAGLMEATGTIYSASNLFSSGISSDGGLTLDLERSIYMHMGDSVWLMVNPAYTYYGFKGVQEYRMCTMHDPANPMGGNFRKTLWREYGWDGSQWVLGHSGSKTIHNTLELLEDGLTITFDDESGTRTFNATDYYTFGVVDGVQLDGATALTHKTSYYYKPTIEGVTDIEAPILPATTRSPLTAEWRTTFTWQNAANLTTGTNVIRRSNTSTSFNSGARSIESIPRHDTLIDPTLRGSVGRVEYRLYSSAGFENTTAPNRVLVGLSDSSVIGTPIDYNSPQFALLIDGSTHLGSYNATMYAVWSGTTVQNLGVIDTNNRPDGQYFRVLIMNDGSVRYDHYNEYFQGWSIIWQSAPGSAPIDRDYYIDAAFAGQTGNSGIEDIRMDRRRPNDYYTMFGNQANQTGRWHPQWYAVDYDHNFEIKIDGITATQIAIDDVSTVLQTGQISVHPTTGMIRYSGDDAGKTMTARYTTIVHE